MSSHRLERRQFLPLAPDRVFPFFAEAGNLERITPPFLNFRILTPEPIEMRPGVHIEYQLRLFGLPMRWLTEITVFEPNRRFVDLQLKGPYKRWHHLHEFREVPGGTEMLDQIDYELPFGPLGDLVHALHVERTLQRIFDFRREAVTRVVAELAVAT